jgi:phosphoglycolate phosphatase
VPGYGGVGYGGVGYGGVGYGGMGYGGVGYGKMDVVQPGVVLFDLDGTLTASGPGITRSVAAALHTLTLPPLDETALLRFVGPPLLDSFRDIAGLDEATALDAMAAYRGYFVEYGMFENTVYPGIPGLLRELVDTGRRLAVATSKPLPYAVPIIEHFALAGYFEAVFGPAIDGDGTEKGDVVAQALSALRVGLDDVVLVGDRVHDVVGAHENGIPCIGALWGYGSREELADAEAVAADVDELAALLGLTHQATGGEDAFA